MASKDLDTVDVDIGIRSRGHAAISSLALGSGAAAGGIRFVAGRHVDSSDVHLEIGSIGKVWCKWQW